MTAKFTKAEPFVFEGLHIWPDFWGNPEVADRMAPRPFDLGAGLRRARALRAYLNETEHVEAERDEWAWTNDGHTEARKGLWAVSINRRNADVKARHDDFPNSWWIRRHADTNVQDTANAVLADFLAWKKAQEQPDEPTALGYVFRADAPRGHTYTHSGFGLWTEDTGTQFRWPEVADLWTRDGVLSEGVAP